MTRRERIIVLLENYVDVLHGLRDRQGDGVHIPLMCRAFNKPRLGYPELERLRLLLKVERPTLYRHLTATYFVQDTRRVLVCPRCSGVMPTWHSKNFHRHGHSNVAVVPRVLRLTPPWIEQGKVEEAIVWLDEHWLEPGPFLPDELQPVKTDKREKAA